MALIGNIGEFIDSQESLTQYTERLEQFFVANDIVEDKKAAVLLAIIYGSRERHFCVRVLMHVHVQVHLVWPLLPRALRIILVRILRTLGPLSVRERHFNLHVHVHCSTFSFAFKFIPFVLNLYRICTCAGSPHFLYKVVQDYGEGITLDVTIVRRGL